MELRGHIDFQDCGRRGANLLPDSVSDCIRLGMSIYICTSNLGEISQSTPEILLLPVSILTNRHRHVILHPSTKVIEIEKRTAEL